MRRRRTNTPLIIASALGVAVLVGMVTAIAVVASRTSANGQGKKDGVVAKPTEAKDGGDWTHKDLLAHLETKGLKYIWIKSNRGKLTIAMQREGVSDQDQRSAFDDHPFTLTHVVFVRLFETEDEARKYAGSSPYSQSWRRFAFTGEADEVELIFRRLPNG